MSFTALRNRSARPCCSNAALSPLLTNSSNSGGRGRLPAWVVRIRSTLCFILDPVS
jgi:hypothetical protein